MDGGANKEAADKEGMTALMCAAHKGHADCVRLLMGGGASKEAKEETGLTALMWAAENGHTDCVRLLMDGGADKEATDQTGMTALIAAAEDGRTECVRLLMDGGANKNAKDECGWTALISAAENGQMDCVRLLITGGADIGARDDTGLTALDRAQRQGNHDMVRLITSCSEAQHDASALMDPTKRAQFIDRSCHNCFKVDTTMFKCGICHKVRYCSRECQKAHWSLHKAKCDRGGEPASPASSQRRDESVSSASSTLSHAIVQQHVPVRCNAPASRSGLDTCHFCAKPQAQIAERLKRCDRCRSVAYCSVECQRGDWSAHKKECAKPA
jgi:hypothetical protein